MSSHLSPSDAPIPSYDEATADDGSHSHDWPPPRSPIDTRPDHETEAQSLLFESHPQGPNASTRSRPSGYRPPYAESDHDDDDNASEWTLEDDGDSDDEHHRYNARNRSHARREMEELDVEDPLNGSLPSSSSSRSRASSLWRKHIAPSLPQWKWRWRLPRMTVRLPRQNDTTAEPQNEPSTTQSANDGNAGSSTIELETRKRAAMLLIGRMLALFLVLGFVYLLFMSDLFTSMSRRVGGRMFDPVAVRQHVQHIIDPVQMRDTLRHLTNYAHIAGTEGDFALARDIKNRFLHDGLEQVFVDEYQVYLNYPRSDGRAVQLLRSDGSEKADEATWEAALEEMAVSAGSGPGRPTWAFHGHSKSGDVKGPLVYANYGTRADFLKLADMGVSVEGGIALIRHLGSQPDAALKVKAAEMAGFAGCLIYSDPSDNGFHKGNVAPDGPWMPADGVHRASVSLTSWIVGDVLTPGWESRENQPRMTRDQTKGLVHIPSLPLAWRDAQPLLQQLQGLGQPCSDDWQGGVPETEWWTGNASSPMVRLKNLQDEEDKQNIWNVYGKIVGVEQPEKRIIIGNHRDAWSFGAAGANSGTSVMLEVSRVLGDLTSRGWRPLRTIEFMNWDGQEYNLIGSTEYVEANLEELQKDAYAYINIGAAVSGPELNAAGSPVFKTVLARVLDRVVDPKLNATLRTLWDERGSKLGALAATGDYVAFQDMAGTNSIDLHFEGPGYPIHSAYDSFQWMSKVGDPDMTYHALMAEVVTLLILELADKPVLPFDMGNYALELGHYTGGLDEWIRSPESRVHLPIQKDKRDEPKKKDLDLEPLRLAVKDVQDAVESFSNWETSWEKSITHSGGWEPSGLGRERCDFNDHMVAFETALLDLEFGGGLPNRTQYKHVVYAPERWNCHKVAYFPAVHDAVEDGDMDLAQEQIAKTAKIISEAAQRMKLDSQHAQQEPGHQANGGA